MAEGVARELFDAKRFGQDIFGVNAIQGEFSIVQLGEWYQHVGRIADPGVVLVKLDESRNRLEMIVVDDAAAQRVEEKLKQIPVPPKAVAVRIREPVKLYESPSEPIPPAKLKEQLSDALLEDLETIAQQGGISLEVAIQRYGSQGSFLALIDTIREMFPQEYAWARVGLAGRGSVGFAGQAPAAALWMIQGFVNRQWGASVEVHSHVGFNELEKQKAISTFHYAMNDAPEVRGIISGLDPETGHLRTDTLLRDYTCAADFLDNLLAGATEAVIEATRPDILNSIKVDVVVHPTTPTRSVDGPVLISPREGLGGVDAVVAGTVTFEEDIGCLYLGEGDRRSPVVWPFGASWQADPPAVKLQGQVIEPGMSVTGGGYSASSYEFVKKVVGVEAADAAKACAEHVDPTDRDIGIDFFNIGSEVDLVP